MPKRTDIPEKICVTYLSFIKNKNEFMMRFFFYYDSI